MFLLWVFVKNEWLNLKCKNQAQLDSAVALHLDMFPNNPYYVETLVG